MKKVMMALLCVSVMCAMAFSAQWEVGVSYSVDDVVTYEDVDYVCTFAHVSNEAWYPGAPGLWFWAVNTAADEWRPGKLYNVGDQVNYNGLKYECVYTHTSQAGWYPGAAGIWFWNEIVEAEQTYGVAGTTPEWSGDAVPYAVGDVVLYGDEPYNCVFAHTSQENWYPGAEGLFFWSKVPLANEWVAGGNYAVNDEVSYDGKNWVCVYAHTAWSPSWYPGAPGIHFWEEK